MKNHLGPDRDSFDQAMVDVMSRALNSAYEHLRVEGKIVYGQEDAVRSTLAKLIIQGAKDGEREVTRLAEFALESFPE
jgi:hypothetical protein